MAEFPEDHIDDDDEDDYFVHEVIKADKAQKPLRIDKFILNRLESVSRNKIQNACHAGNVTVNGHEIKPNYKVRPHDEIVVILDKPPGYKKELEAEEIPLNIVYEDADVLVIDKQPGLVVHPGTGNYTGTLVNGLIHYFKERALPVMQGNQPDRPGIVHRIDKDTSGLMVIAKTEEAITHLAKQFYDHSIEREYLALVWGDVEEPEGTIEGNIGRHPTDRLKMYVYDDGSAGKRAVTHYKLLENLYYVSLVSCVLETGRTHQIRAHFKHIGHTLFNDSRYGGDKILKGTVFSKYRSFVENNFKIMNRQALHAHALGFIHPRTGEKMYFKSELPDDFKEVLDRWRNYLSSRKSIES